MEYKQIIREAASRKIVEITKTFLDIVDELKSEEAANFQKFLIVAEASGLGEKAKELQPFLATLDDSKKNIVRKRILDKANSLIRELEQ